MQTYRDLIVWQKAHGNFLAIIKFVDQLPQCRAAWEVARQIIRAAGSIGANIAEGHGRQALRRRKQDYINFLEIAFASANEVDYWLTVILDVGWVSREVVTPLLEANTEVLRMLYVFIQRTETTVVRRR
jgi:four helix bundle protein